MDILSVIALIAKCAGLLMVVLFTLKLTTRKTRMHSSKTARQPMTKIPTLKLTFRSARNLEFEWTGVVGAYQYQLLEKTDDYSGFQAIGRPKKPGTRGLTWTIPLHSRLNARYMLRAFHYDGSIDSNSIHVGDQLITVLRRPAHTAEGLGFIAQLSHGGRTLTLAEDDHSPSRPDTYPGATHVFEFDNFGQWVKRAYVPWVAIMAQASHASIEPEKTAIDASVPSLDRVASPNRKHSWLSGYGYSTLSLFSYNQP